MSALEVPAFLIGLATVFSSCVDAFSLFKLAQRADKDVEVVLLKLDIQKTRLLIWGDNVGIFSANHRSPELLDERLVGIIQRILGQVEKLLTDSEKLRASYGVRNLDTTLERTVDYISCKSLAVFRTSSTRFWTRNLKKLASSPQGTIFAKTKWAIYEKEKFQDMINNLSDLIDNLFEFVHVARETQDRIIVEDIESILDVSRLAIIEEATEGSYSIYSQAAASARALTETASVDRRTLAEHLRDVEDASWPTIGSSSQKSAVNDLDSLCTELDQCKKFIVLTSSCRRLQTQDPCCIRQLGSQATFVSKFSKLEWDISSRNKAGGNTLSQLIDRLIDIRQKVKGVDEFNPLGEALKAGINSTQVQDELLAKSLPLLELVIYCSPCVCLMQTALVIGKELSSPLLKVCIRPDDRLISSCCVNVDRTLGLKSALRHVREWESDAKEHGYDGIASFLDCVWLDRRLESLDYEQPYDYKEEPYNSGERWLIIGEASYIAPFVQKTPGRIPMPMEIWEISGTSTPIRKRFARFIEAGAYSRTPATRVTASESSITSAQVIPQQVRTQMLGARRASSPASSDSKRRKIVKELSEMGRGEVLSDESDLNEITLGVAEETSNYSNELGTPV